MRAPVDEHEHDVGVGRHDHLDELGLQACFPTREGDVFRVGVFLDSVRRTTRTEDPHGGASYVRGAKRSRIDPRWGEVERLTPRTRELERVGSVVALRLPGLLVVRQTRAEA